MKNKEEIFKLLRESVEDEREAKIVEDIINKIELKMPKIEVVDETHVKCEGITYRRNKKTGHYDSYLALHRFIWIYFNGEIPSGFDIHHKNENPGDNEIHNLKMLTKSEHCKIHNDIAHNQALNNYITRQCPVCGKSFTFPKYATRKYCSTACSDKAHTINKLDIRICPVCGKSFHVRKSLKQIYCSRTCAYKTKNKRKRLKYIVLKCPICGKEFESKMCSHQKYCSRKCFYEARKNHNK